MIANSNNTLVGGTATAARPEVGIFTNGRGGICTATLIHRQHIITAAHCLDPNLRDFSVAPGAEFRLGIHSYTVSRYHSFSSGVTTQTNGSRYDNDIAVIRLRHPVQANIAAPAVMASRRPWAWDWVTAFGYGCTKRSPRTGSGSKQYFEFTASNATSTLCAGDSGGPVFIGRHNGSGGLYAVNSGYWVSTQEDIFGDVVSHKYQIESVIRQWNGGSLEYDFDRPGGNYRTFIVLPANENACRQACSADSKCRAFTYRKSDGQCRLKDRVPAMRPSEGLTSGLPTNTVGTSVLPRSSYETNVSRSGNPLLSIANMNVADCALSCARDHRCKAWRHSVWTGSCDLKSSEGAPSSYVGATSGKRRGLEVNTDRPGFSYQTLSSGPLPESCQASCAADNNCRAWTHVASSSSGSARCFLKSSVLPPYSTAGSYAGWRFQSPGRATVWIDDPINVDRPGWDYRSYFTFTGHGTCKMACRNESQCQAWAYRPSAGFGGYCHLKNGRPTAKNTTNMVSGVKGKEFLP